MNKINYDYLVGKKFSRLTIENIIFKKDKANYNRVFVICSCYCGKNKTIRLDSVLEKRVKAVVAGQLM